MRYRIAFRLEKNQTELFIIPSAVVHHGGSGTTHTAVKYACPSLAIPHAMDQFFWAKTIAALQLGPQYLPVKNLNEKDFEHRVVELLSNETYKSNAAKLSTSMKIESNADKLYEMIASRGFKTK